MFSLSSSRCRIIHFLLFHKLWPKYFHIQLIINARESIQLLRPCWVRMSTNYIMRIQHTYIVYSTCNLCLICQTKCVFYKLIGRQTNRRNVRRFCTEFVVAFDVFSITIRWADCATAWRRAQTTTPVPCCCCCNLNYTCTHIQLRIRNIHLIQLSFMFNIRRMIVCQ